MGAASTSTSRGSPTLTAPTSVGPALVVRASGDAARNASALYRALPCRISPLRGDTQASASLTTGNALDDRGSIAPRITTGVGQTFGAP